MFQSYVSLPEGTLTFSYFSWDSELFWPSDNDKVGRTQELAHRQWKIIRLRVMSALPPKGGGLI